MMKIFYILLAIIGTVLLSLNLIGLIPPLDDTLKSVGIHPKREHLSFRWTIDQLKNIENSHESDVSIEQRLMTIIHKRVVNYAEFKSSILLVNPTENWLLWLLGLIQFDNFHRYIFADPYRSLQRGLAQCGQAAELLIILLQRIGYEAGVQPLDGHVIAWMRKENETILLDPDCGIILPFDASYASLHLEEVLKYYKNALASLDDKEIAYMINTYRKPLPPYAQGNLRFATRARMEREDLLYFLKWIIPLVLEVPVFIWWITDLLAKRRLLSKAVPLRTVTFQQASLV